jgi:hypothetical protein
LDRICDSLHLLACQEPRAGLQTHCKDSPVNRYPLLSCSISASARAALALASLCFSASVRLLAPVSSGVAASSSPCAVFCAVSLCTISGATPAPGGPPPPLGITNGQGFLDSPLHLLLSRGYACTIVVRVVHLLLLPRPYHAAGVSRLLTPETCTEASPQAAGLERSGAGKPVFLGRVR